jgi:hypothetical protein
MRRLVLATVLIVFLVVWQHATMELTGEQKAAFAG